MLLTLSIFIPLAGALVLLFIPDKQKTLIRWTALLTTIVAFIPMVAIAVGYAKKATPDAPAALLAVANERVASIQDPALRAEVELLRGDPSNTPAKLAPQR